MSRSFFSKTGVGVVKGVRLSVWWWREEEEGGRIMGEREMVVVRVGVGMDEEEGGKKA